MAELKVRVDGVSRVVCGVTETTSCQDVVIALAHAIGRTGRFTLIEKWRDSERPLLPSDCPLQVLHKWGEYASEVQLLLHQSDKKEQVSQQQQQLNKIEPGLPPPAKEKDSGIRRVLTFSGAHNTESSKRPPFRSPKQRQFMGKISEDPQSGLPNEISYPPPTGQRSREDVHYRPDHQNFHPAFRDKENVLLNGGSGYQDTQRGVRPGQNGVVHRHPTPSSEHVQSQPHAVPNLRTDLRNPKRMEARVNPIQRMSPRTTHGVDQSNKNGYYPHPKHRQSEESVHGGEQVNRARLPSPHIDNVRASAFQRVVPNRQTSPYRSKESERAPEQNGEVEEYDLDSNFPSVPRERVVLEEYRMPGDGHHDNNFTTNDQKERVKLQRLVSMQQERIKMQESQLSIIDTGM